MEPCFTEVATGNSRPQFVYLGETRKTMFVMYLVFWLRLKAFALCAFIV